MKSQVNKEHYDFNKYVDKQRWMSYYYQISLIEKLEPNNILEIGVGNRVIKKILGDTLDYKSLDISEDLNPDYIGSVDNIPLEDNTFDLVCAFQVLEHLPFEKFEICLKEMARISKKNVLISLPYFHYYLKIKVPLLRTFNIRFGLFQFLKNFKFNGEHYWEIGTSEYPLRKIKNIMSKNFKIKKIIHPFANRYHIFFVLEKITGND